MGLGDQNAMAPGGQLELLSHQDRHATGTEVGDLDGNDRQKPPMPIQPSLHGVLHRPTLALSQIQESSLTLVSIAESG
jgi:hypothetical protein